MTSLEEELALGWYVQALWRRWVLIVVIALLAGAAGFLVASLRPVLFEGVTTLLMLPPPRTPAAPVNPATFLAILENASFASKVIGETELSQTPQTLPETAFQIEQPAGTNVLKIRVQSKDPKTAADASRRLANAAIALTERLNQEEGSSLQEQLKEHLQDASLRLAAAEKELLSYQQSAQLELIKEDTDAMLAERGDLLKLTIAIESERARLAAAEREIARQKPLLSAPRIVGAEEALQHAQEGGRASEGGRVSEGARASGGAPASEGVRAPEPTTPLKESKRERDLDGPAGAAGTQSLDLTNPYVNPVYQTLDFQIAMSRTHLAALDQQRRQIVDVTKTGGKEIARLSELYRRKIEQARLETNLDFARKIHGDLLFKYEESRTQSLGSNPQLRLVDEAIVQDRPLPRKRLQSGAIGLATGLLGAGLLALMLEGRNRVWVSRFS